MRLPTAARLAAASLLLSLSADLAHGPAASAVEVRGRVGAVARQDMAARAMATDGASAGKTPDGKPNGKPNGIPTPVPAPVPFGVGEVLTYKATFGGIPAGTGRMEVASIDTLRGRAVYHVIFSINGGIPLFRVRDRYESWIDVETLSSLKHVQSISEGRYKRETTYEMFPESAQYRRNDEPLQPSVSNPLDDGSFIYAVRAAAVEPGQVRRDDRYFRPDRNPVILTGVKRDTISVGAGTFPSVVVRPTIRTKGIFSEGGDAQVWFSDDAHRIPVQVKSKFAKFSLTLSLTSVVYGETVRP